MQVSLSRTNSQAPIYIPKSQDDIGPRGISLYLLKRSASIALYLRESHPYSWFLRHVMELVYRMLNNESVQIKYAEMLYLCYTGRNQPINHEMARAHVEEILSLPLPPIYVDEGADDDFFCEVKREKPHAFRINGGILGPIVTILPTEEEFERAVFYYTVVLIHEIGHYMWLKSQWLSEGEEMDKTLLYTPTTVNEGGDGPDRNEDGELIGESGAWIEAQLFGFMNGNGRVVMENKPECATFGHLWWWDNSGTDELCTRISESAVKEFVRVDRRIETVWPVPMRETVHADWFSFHPVHLS